MKTQEKNNSFIFLTKPFSNRTTYPCVPDSLHDVLLIKAFFISAAIHFFTGLLLWSLVFCFNFLNTKLGLFPNPIKPTKDIEFILTKKTKSKITINSETEPKNNQNINKPLSTLPEKVSNSQLKNSIEPKTKLKSSSLNSNMSGIPSFESAMPKSKSISSGLEPSKKLKSYSAGFNASDSSINNMGSALFENENSLVGSNGSKNITKKMVESYDISPYVNELSRNIKSNWKVPKSHKRVEIFLRIAKDGRPIITNVKRTSEIGDIDNAALNAVKKCLPLMPLPSKYNKSYLDVVFVFEMNSINSQY